MCYIILCHIILYFTLFYVMFLFYYILLYCIIYIVFYRAQVLENLSREDIGSFIIRESSTHDTCFALSVKVPKFNNPTGIAHYIIHRTPSHGFKFKVGTRFTSLCLGKLHLAIRVGVVFFLIEPLFVGAQLLNILPFER